MHPMAEVDIEGVTVDIVEIPTKTGSSIGVINENSTVMFWEVPNMSHFMVDTE